jgi:hypothetical protein
MKVLMILDWHFTVYGGVSVPTGNPNKYDRARDPKGEFEADMATGFENLHLPLDLLLPSS